MQTSNDLSKYLVAEIDIVYKTKIKASDRPKISNSKDAFNILWDFVDHDKIEHIETAYVMLLSRSMKVLGVKKISEGGTAGTIMDLKVIFQAALKGNAHALILCHNHPSGTLTPSEQDKDVTKRIKEAGRILEIAVSDHIILTPEGKYISFADEGLI